MVNYKNAKIYRIVDRVTGNCYIGSTCAEYLSSRLIEHKSRYKQFISGVNPRYITSFEIIKNANYYIELLENVNCKNKNQLTKREIYWTSQFDCVNKRAGGIC